MDGLSRPVADGGRAGCRDVFLAIAHPGDNGDDHRDHPVSRTASQLPGDVRKVQLGHRPRKRLQRSGPAGRVVPFAKRRVPEEPAGRRPILRPHAVSDSTLRSHTVYVAAGRVGFIPDHPSRHLGAVQESVRRWSRSENVDGDRRDVGLLDTDGGLRSRVPTVGCGHLPGRPVSVDQPALRTLASVRRSSLVRPRAGYGCHVADSSGRLLNSEKPLRMVRANSCRPDADALKWRQRGCQRVVHGVADYRFERRRFAAIADVHGGSTCLARTANQAALVRRDAVLSDLADDAGVDSAGQHDVAVESWPGEFVLADARAVAGDPGDASLSGVAT